MPLYWAECAISLCCVANRSDHQSYCQLLGCGDFPSTISLHHVGIKLCLLMWELDVTHIPLTLSLVVVVSHSLEPSLVQMRQKLLGCECQPCFFALNMRKALSPGKCVPFGKLLILQQGENFALVGSRCVRQAYSGNSPNQFHLEMYFISDAACLHLLRWIRVVVVVVWMMLMMGMRRLCRKRKGKCARGGGRGGRGGRGWYAGEGGRGGCVWQEEEEGVLVEEEEGCVFGEEEEDSAWEEEEEMCEERRVCIGRRKRRCVWGGRGGCAWEEEEEGVHGEDEVDGV